MPGFRLTQAAKADMLGVGRYTRQQWGSEQMRRYIGAFLPRDRGFDCAHRSRLTRSHVA